MWRSVREASPLVFIAAGYGAGLATGLARFPALSAVTGCLAVAALALRRHRYASLLAALATGAFIGGRARVASTASCAARLPLGDQHYQLRSIDPGEGTGRVAILGMPCRGAILARWPRTSRLPAGRELHVVARWTRVARPLDRPDGMLQIAAIDSVAGTPLPVERLRTALVRSSRNLFGVRAPLVNALIAGWRGELDPELRRAFASAGLMHLLAISGLHIACLAAWLFALARLARVPRHPAEGAIALASLAYVAFLGWPAAATRAVALLSLAAFCRWRQRHVRTDAVLAASTLLLLMGDPWSVSDVGAWMSVLGVSGLVIATRWSDRNVGRQWWTRSISGSLGAVVATAPITAAVFGQVAPIGILLTVIGTPLLVVTLPVVFLAVLLEPILTPVAHSFAAAGNVLLTLLEAVVRLGARAPGASAGGDVGWHAAIPWIGVLAAGVWIVAGRTTRQEAARRAAWATTAAAWLALAGPTQRNVADDHRLALVFLDVGQGDAALIRTPLGHWIVVDAGPVGEGSDAGRRIVVPALRREGARRVDMFVMSHAHRDHVGGGAAVLDQLPLELALDPGELFADPAYETWLVALAEHRARWRTARAGTSWAIDGVNFRVVHPPSPWVHEGEDLNEDSIVLEITYRNFRALFMGDAGFVAESALVATLRPVDVLKVGHHGSRTASSAAFLAVVQPQVAVVSVGRNNYGHPAPETLGRLAGANISLWRTDREGTVTVTTDGRSFTVTGAGAAATFTAHH